MTSGVCKMFFFLIFLLSIYSVSSEDRNSFCDNFKFGVATASYQIEGAWNEDGKTENIWDHSLHENPNYIDDKSNGDVACDSYHKWREDVELIKNLGANFYRFSISWNRILPEGVKNSPLNSKGVLYYNNLINGLIEAGIEPYVTIFHWDTPQILEEKGGWLNETIIDDYVFYAKTLFELYGDRVKTWITFNEPSNICNQGYSTAQKAPFQKHEGTACYTCYHYVAIAHAKVYRLYQKEFKSTQNGKVGITIDAWYGFPKTDSESDRKAAEQYMTMNAGWYYDPIVNGNYPQEMISRIAELSKKQGFKTSRLPEFTKDQTEILRGSYDFLGLNHYTSVLCNFDEKATFPEPSHDSDVGVVISRDPSWKPSAADWLYSSPEGIRKMLNWLKDQYNNPPVVITENGWSTYDKGLEDDDRVEYYKNYLAEILKAIQEDGCNVEGYTAWSMMDNFEWTYGYTQRYGLIYVDFESVNRTRTPRKSYDFFKKIIETRKLN